MYVCKKQTMYLILEMKCNKTSNVYEKRKCPEVNVTTTNRKKKKKIFFFLWDLILFQLYSEWDVTNPKKACGVSWGNNRHFKIKRNEKKIRGWWCQQRKRRRKKASLKGDSYRYQSDETCNQNLIFFYWLYTSLSHSHSDLVFLCFSIYLKHCESSNKVSSFLESLITKSAL